MKRSRYSIHKNKYDRRSIAKQLEEGYWYIQQQRANYYMNKGKK